MNKVRISVPATSANIGPGFDCFGMAWDLCNVIECEKIAGKRHKFVGVEKRFANDDNLFIKSYYYLLSKMENVGENFKLKLKFDCKIPISRGLGSSSSLIVAGLMCCNKMHGNKFSRNDILKFATEIEGHPDNVAPVIFGGFVISMQKNGLVFVRRQKIAKNIKFCAIIPDFELSTEKTRAILPKQVDMHDVVFNISHSCMLLKGFEIGNVELIKHCLDDKIHQNYRAIFIPEFTHLKQFVDKNAICLCISGAGPTMLCLYDDDDFISKLKKQTKMRIVKLNLNLRGAQFV
ncbi:MAG: homoserine kinase [Rickettsiales bacterium]|nr:homoserine kinase [Rickettsiales bacterium]